MAEFFIARAGYETCLVPNPTLPGDEEDKNNNRMPVYLLLPSPSLTVKKKIIWGVLEETFLFRHVPFGCCLVAESCSQFAYSAHDVSYKKVIWTFRITKHYVIRSQKVWGLNEHSQIFEMENLLCSSFCIKCRLLWEWF